MARDESKNRNGSETTKWVESVVERVGATGCDLARGWRKRIRECLNEVNRSGNRIIIRIVCRTVLNMQDMTGEMKNK